MEELVDQALMKAPAVSGAAATIRAQDALAQAARSAYWPQLELNAGLAQTTSVSPSQTNATPFSLGTTSLAVRQQIFTFGKVAAAVELADAQAEAARAQAALTAAEVAFGVRQSYLAWTQAQGIEAQLAEQVGFTGATVAEARARFKAGAAPRLDVTRAETAIAQARASLATARATTGQARRSLAAAIGETSPVAGEPAFPPVLAIASRPLAELQQAALRHPSLRAQDAELAQARAASNAADRAGLPDISGDASYGIRARDFAGAPNYQFGVSANWPLFTGFNVTHRAEAAHARADAVLQARAGVRLAVLRDVDNAHMALDGARQALPAAKAALDAARANLAQARGRYRGGVGSIIEVADAQSLLATAQADHVRATAAFHLAIANLQRALGATGAAK